MDNNPRSGHNTSKLALVKKEVLPLQKNVGDFDAYLRIAGGLTLVGLGIMHRSKLALVMGSGKVAEGVTRWCPLMHAMGVKTTEGVIQEVPKPHREAQPEVSPDAFYTE